jgi:hypothetical protein
MKKYNSSQNSLAVNPAGTVIPSGTVDRFVVNKLPAFINYTDRTDANHDSMTKLLGHIRHSREYSEYTGFLKYNVHMNIDTLFPFLSSDMASKYKNSARIRMEIHHTPFKLVEIARTVCNKHIMDHGYANEFEVADEVMLLHYKHYIGLIPLSKSVHEVIHAEACEICPNLVWGYWKAYVAEYYPYFDEVSRQKYEALQDWELSDSSYEVPEVLKVRFSVIQCEGFPLWQHPILDESKYQQIAASYTDDLLRLAS